jgi:hypothetical protein
LTIVIHDEPKAHKCVQKNLLQGAYEKPVISSEAEHHYDTTKQCTRSMFASADLGGSTVQLILKNKDQIKEQGKRNSCKCFKIKHG